MKNKFERAEFFYPKNKFSVEKKNPHRAKPMWIIDDARIHACKPTAIHG
jgi:hypothetical protein